MTAITIQCLLIRAGGTHVQLGANDYHFAPDADGNHVCVVEDPDDLATLLGIKEGYRIHRTKTPPVVAAPTPVVPPVPPVALKEPVAAPAVPKKAATKKAATAEPVADVAPMGLTGTSDDLAAMDRDAVAALFTTEMGRAPSEHADIEVMIEQIKAKREASKAGA